MLTSNGKRYASIEFPTHKKLHKVVSHDMVILVVFPVAFDLCVTFIT